MVINLNYTAENIFVNPTPALTLISWLFIYGETSFHSFSRVSDFFAEFIILRKSRCNQTYLEFRKETFKIPRLKGFLVTPILSWDRFKKSLAGVVELVETRDLKYIYMDWFCKLKSTKSSTSKYFLDYSDPNNHL